MAWGLDAERRAALRALRRLRRAGWVVTHASDGEDTIETDSPQKAVEHVMATEQGAIDITHPDWGKASLLLLFQGGEGEEVIYDWRARSDDALLAIDSALDPRGNPPRRLRNVGGWRYETWEDMTRALLYNYRLMKSPAGRKGYLTALYGFRANILPPAFIREEATKGFQRALSVAIARIERDELDEEE